MATPISGSGPNAPKSIKTATYGPLRGAQKPISKKISIPPAGRDTLGRVNLGL